MTQEGALFIVDGYAKILFQFIYCELEILIAVLSSQISLSYDEHWHNLGGAKPTRHRMGSVDAPDFHQKGRDISPMVRYLCFTSVPLAHTADGHLGTIRHAQLAAIVHNRYVTACYRALALYSRVRLSL